MDVNKIFEQAKTLEEAAALAYPQHHMGEGTPAVQREAFIAGMKLMREAAAQKAVSMHRGFSSSAWDGELIRYENYEGYVSEAIRAIGEED